MSTDSNDLNINVQHNMDATDNNIPLVPMNTGRVFMLEQSQNVDVKPAFEYGPIIPLFKSTNGQNSNVKRKTDRPSMWDTDEFKKEILKRLEQYNYDPERDYLLIAGHFIPIVIFIATVVAEWENVQVLFWSTGYEKYVIRKL